MKTNHNQLRTVLFAVTVLIFLTSTIAHADPATWTPDPLFPDYYQKSAGVNLPNVACAPVAATDSLVWLSQKYNLPNLFLPGISTWQDMANRLETAPYMNTTANGTYSGNLYNGVQNYIQAAGYQNQISVEAMLGGQRNAPTVDWIENQVALGQDVDIEIGWIQDQGAGNPAKWLNGHFVAVTGYNANDLLIADPWTGPGANNGESLAIDGTGQTTLNFDAYGNYTTKYTLTYPQVTLNDGITVTGTSYEIIYGAIAESVPEPATLLLLGLGAVALRRKRS